MSSDSAEVAPLPRHEQKELEQLCLWATVSAGWSFSSIKNPEVVEFIACLNPAFKLPGHNKLSGSLLEMEYESMQNKLTDIMKGSYAMAQCDGWKDTWNHLIAFMVTANQTVHILLTNHIAIYLLMFLYRSG